MHKDTRPSLYPFPSFSFLPIRDLKAWNSPTSSGDTVKLIVPPVIAMKGKAILAPSGGENNEKILEAMEMSQHDTEVYECNLRSSHLTPISLSAMQLKEKGP